MTDFQEYLTATDPTNEESVFRLLKLTSFSGNTTLLWSSTPGKNYRVQFRDDVDAGNWIDLPGIVTATGSTASQVDQSGGAGEHRFYRVVLMP